MCEYCNFNKPLENNKFMYIELEIFEGINNLKVDTKEDTHTRVNINYCPMCGRKLI